MDKRLIVVTLVMLLSATLLSKETKEPWGKEYTTEQDKTRITQVLNLAKEAPDTLITAFSDTVVIGPALWTRLKKADAGLSKQGTPMSGLQPGSNQTYEQRAYIKEGVSDLVKSVAIKDLFVRFSAGKVRAATEKERETYYYTIPFDIADEPLTVVEFEGDVLLINLSEGKVLWLEMLSDWKKGKL